jgi:L,D-peptidoglycan transpeptidase YkuD (ErfK/YbiS/YcfS/YnhG family)
MRATTAVAAIAAVLCAGGVAPAVAAPAAGPPAHAPTNAQAPAEAASRVHLGGVRVRLANGTRQVVTVHHREGWHARVALWERRAGSWVRLASARDGRTGYGGLVRGVEREQGTGTTPLGSYRMTESFGLAARPAGAELAFHRVRAGDYWVQDNASRWYNTLRHRHQGGFRWRLDGYNSSERLRDYRGQYRWSVVIDFNRPNPVRHRGSGIFLHVNGEGATAGCVSTPRRLMRLVMQRLDPANVPVIAIGR